MLHSLISSLRRLRSVRPHGPRNNSRRKYRELFQHRPALETLEERQMLSISQLSIQDATVLEGDVGSTDMVLDVTLSAPVEHAVSVGYATVGTSPLVTK